MYIAHCKKCPGVLNLRLKLQCWQHSNCWDKYKDGAHHTIHNTFFYPYTLRRFQRLARIKRMWKEEYVLQIRVAASKKVEALSVQSWRERRTAAEMLMPANILFTWSPEPRPQSPESKASDSGQTKATLFIQASVPRGGGHNAKPNLLYISSLYTPRNVHIQVIH